MSVKALRLREADEHRCTSFVVTEIIEQGVLFRTWSHNLHLCRMTSVTHRLVPCISRHRTSTCTCIAEAIVFVQTKVEKEIWQKKGTELQHNKIAWNWQRASYYFLIDCTISQSSKQRWHFVLSSQRHFATLVVSLFISRLIRKLARRTNNY